jgi:hypothetical protein
MFMVVLLGACGRPEVNLRESASYREGSDKARSSKSERLPPADLRDRQVKAKARAVRET